MIVLDEHLDDPEIKKAIERWYPGKVINITEARRKTRILDPAIPALLLRLKDPTFVTINWSDFWPHRRAIRHRGYCMICLKLTLDRVLETPEEVRAVLRQFPNKRDRMGKILLVGQTTIEVFPPE